MNLRALASGVPASYFGMVLGLAGLGGLWRAAHAVWLLPSVIGEMLTLAASLVWAVLVVLFGLKWLLARQDAVAEIAHPVQGCFVGLIGVATMLIAGGALPYSRSLAIVLFSLGASFTLLVAVWLIGGLWQGDRDPAATTPVLYLPAVAGGFATANTLASFGYADWGQLAFGGGLFSWLAIESVLLHRLLTGPQMAAALRPTFGIQLAPPAVGAMAYMGISQGPPDMLSHALLGYGLLQALVLIRLSGWLRQQPFGPGYWAFTFGATALALTPLRMMERGDSGAAATLAPILFTAANAFVLLVAVRTLWLGIRRASPRCQSRPRQPLRLTNKGDLDRHSVVPRSPAE